jgi:5-formyltetrahydrofolate cyclo-ligase
MAVPRLREKKCFRELDPARLRKSDLAQAATIGGATRFGRAVHPRELEHIDLIVAGSVAVNRAGARIGKGGGYSDLEYAIGRELGVIDGKTRTATTVHPLQLLDQDLPVTEHDFSLDMIATPEEVIRPPADRRKTPGGILAAHLTAEIRRDVPILKDLGF